MELYGDKFNLFYLLITETLFQELEPDDALKVLNFQLSVITFIIIWGRRGGPFKVHPAENMSAEIERP